jgi:hypothetical protein
METCFVAHIAHPQKVSMKPLITFAHEYARMSFTHSGNKRSPEKGPPVPPDQRPIEPVKEPPKPGPGPDTPRKKIVRLS